MTDDPATADGADDNWTASVQRAVVRDRYGTIATESGSCCGDTDCCADSTAHSLEVGYTDDDLAAVEADANLGLGCGNPTAIAGLDEGETVLDLGSGGGFDCFLAARAVGPTGHVIGVDMTPEMVERARETAETADTTNVEFRLGEIEHLPVSDESVDVVMSNCVVNLSPTKPQVFREVARVLRPGGRLVISDVVRTGELPGALRTDPDSVAACVGGAAAIPELESMLADAGLTDVSIDPDGDSEAFIDDWDDEHELAASLSAATIRATKPAPDPHP